MLAERADKLAETDRRLDGGLGACRLNEAAIARLVEDAMLHFDSSRYRLLAWCIMPNHVHVVVEPLAGIVLAPSSAAGSHFPRAKRIEFSAAADHFDIETISTDLFVTKAIWREPLTMSRITRSMLAWPAPRRRGLGVQRDFAKVP
jgi:hypothetical protein